ncbi:EGF-like domain protein, partial [Ancylostoma duodenale]
MPVTYSMKSTGIRARVHSLDRAGSPGITPFEQNNYLRFTEQIHLNNINECSVGNGGCSQLCVNLPGSFECQCKPGYIMTYDRRTCE